MEFLSEIFKLLKDNKELPYYQAERRIDIFINLFLEEIIKQFTPFKDTVFIAPEFPLKKVDSNLSTKVDYLCFDEIKNSILFVELKTDKQSFSRKQLDIYRRYDNWQTCLREFNIISSFSDKRYHQKLDTLNKKLQLIKGDPSKIKIHVIYISPYSNKMDSALGGIGNNMLLISFEKLAEFIPSKYIKEWKYFYDSILMP